MDVTLCIYDKSVPCLLKCSYSQNQTCGSQPSGPSLSCRRLSNRLTAPMIAGDKKIRHNMQNQAKDFLHVPQPSCNIPCSSDCPSNEESHFSASWQSLPPLQQVAPFQPMPAEQTNQHGCAGALWMRMRPPHCAYASAQLACQITLMTYGLKHANL